MKLSYVKPEMNPFRCSVFKKNNKKGWVLWANDSALIKLWKICLLMLRFGLLKVCCIFENVDRECVINCSSLQKSYLMPHKNTFSFLKYILCHWRKWGVQILFFCWLLLLVIYPAGPLWPKQSWLFYKYDGTDSVVNAAD